MLKKSNKFSPLRKFYIPLLAILVASMVFAGLELSGVTNLINNEAPPSQDGINYGPPTEEELQETEANKEGLVNNESTPSPSSSPALGQKKSVTVEITAWGQNASNQSVEVSGYVSGIIEDGGTCTATMEMGTQKVTSARTATINAQNTSCGFITVDRSKLTPGNWKVTLSYSSSGAEGSSSPITLEVN